MKILHVSPSFYPAVAFGGPIFSTRAITDGVAANPAISVQVLTTDVADPNSKARLHLDQNPAKFESGCSVRYCRSLAGTSISAELLWRLVKEIRSADVVHLTGPYNFPVMPTLLLCRLFGKALVWSPRGGFQATAQWKAAPKRRVKDFFEKLCGVLRPRSLVLHVTAEVEAETSRRNLGNVSSAQIPNAIDVPADLPERNWRPKWMLRLAFLSRIHPKKGLEVLFEALADLPEHVVLDIYGDGDADYLVTLQSKASELGIAHRTSFKGHVNGAQKSRAFTDCDLFVLPTHSENFGIVVAEALAHGTPVITTFNAPWEGLEKENCGRWVEASKDAIAAAIVDLVGLDLAEIGIKGRDWIRRDFSTPGMVRRFLELYRSMQT